MPSDTAYLISQAADILIKIVYFILGYLIIRLGYQLIYSGLKGEFKFSVKLSGLKADLMNISPGLFFLLLGILLIGYAIHFERGDELGKKASTFSEETLGLIPEKLPLPPHMQGKLPEIMKEEERSEQKAGVPLEKPPHEFPEKFPFEFRWKDGKAGEKAEHKNERTQPLLTPFEKVPSKIR